MKTSNKSVFYFIALIILTLVFLFCFYGKVLKHPNGFLFTSHGDGMKSYYASVYYIDKNKSFINFEGMNYPYGENFTYIDCQPVFAVFLKSINLLFPALSKYNIAFFNLLMILSIGVTIVVLYLLFRKLQVGYFLSLLGAIGIAVLSPQTFRMTCHFSLSYSFFIPLTIYFLLIFEEKPQKIYSFVLLTLSGLFFFFIHPYLGMISATLLIVYLIINSIVLWISNKKLFPYKKQLFLLVSAILPVLFFYVFVKITDIHVGRTTNPYGIFEYHAEPASVFLPVSPPLDKLKNLLFPQAQQPWEGWAYIGFSTILVLSVYLLISLVNLFRKKGEKQRTVEKNTTFVWHLFFASVIILLFSMLIPFRWKGFEHWINYFDFIKPFRSLGRFAWVFYFVSTIMSVYIVDRFTKKFAHRTIKYLVYVLAIAVPVSLFAEGFNYHKITSKEIVKSPNLFNKNQISSEVQSDIKSIQQERFQAILPFPFFLIGSENFGKTADENIYKWSFLFSYYLNLPMIGGSSARTSILESKKVMQLLASNFYKKEIINDFPNKKPFLIVSLNDKLNQTEMNYLQKAEIIAKRDEYSLYSVPFDVFFMNNASEEKKKFDDIKDKLYSYKGFFVSDTSLYFEFVDYNKDSELSFSSGNGCYSGLQRDFNILFSIKGNKLSLGKKYTARFWMYNDGENYGQDRLAGMIFFQKVSQGKVQWLDPIINAGNSHEINGNWSLVEISFIHDENDVSYDLVYKGSDIAEKTIYIDELLFYDNELSVYKILQEKDKSILFFNNHRIELKE